MTLAFWSSVRVRALATSSFVKRRSHDLEHGLVLDLRDPLLLVGVEGVLDELVAGLIGCLADFGHLLLVDLPAAERLSHLRHWASLNSLILVFWSSVTLSSF